MSLSKTDLVAWRDEVIEEMQRITKAPGDISGGGINLDNQKRMALLSGQLEAINRLLSLVDGPKSIKLEGVDQ